MPPSPPAQHDPPYLTSHKFTTTPQARNLIDAQIERLMNGTSRAQYLSFTPVSQRTLHTIDEGRFNGQRTIPKCTRLTYYPSSSEMVVKLTPLPSLQCAHHLLEFQILAQGDGESREADASFQPFFGEGGRGWPSVVVEVGFKECVERVRRDAVWWFCGDDEGEGEGEGEGVSVALVVVLDVDERKIVVEKWERPPLVGEGRRGARRGGVKTQEVSAAKDGVQEGELVIGRRKCNGEIERGIVISAGEVERWAELVFPV